MQLYSDDPVGGHAFGWETASSTLTRMGNFEAGMAIIGTNWVALYEGSVVDVSHLRSLERRLTPYINKAAAFRRNAAGNSAYRQWLQTQPQGADRNAVQTKLDQILTNAVAARFYAEPPKLLEDIRTYSACARLCESKLAEMKAYWETLARENLRAGGGGVAALRAQMEVARDAAIAEINADGWEHTQILRKTKVAELSEYVDAVLNVGTSAPLKTAADVDELYEAGVDAVGKGRFKTAMMQVRALLSVSSDVAQPQNVKIHAQRRAIDLKRDAQRMRKNAVAAGGLGGPKGGASALLSGVSDLLSAAGTKKELLIGAGELLGGAAIAGASKLGSGAKIVAKAIGTGIHDTGSLAKTLAESYRDIRKAEFEGAKDVANTVVQALKGVTRPEKTQSAMLAASIREAKEAQARALAHAHAAHEITKIQAATAAATTAIAGGAGALGAAGAPGAAGAAPGAQWRPGALIGGVRGAAGAVMAGSGGVGLGLGAVGAGTFAANDVPGWNVLRHSVGGMKLRTNNGALLRHQLVALRVVGDFLAGVPGGKPLQSMLAFHSMGSGKSPLIHAIVNLIVGAGTGLEGGATPTSLACRVALLWQSVSDAERQMAFLRANQYGVLGGTVAAGHEIPGIITASIDNSADHDALKNQLGLPTRSWFVRLAGAKSVQASAEKSLEALRMGLRDKQREIAQMRLDKSRLDNGGTSIYATAPRFTETQLAAAMKEAVRVETNTARQIADATRGLRDKTAATAAAGATHTCTEANRTLVIVDECHKLFADGNLAFAILLSCVACKHATVVLMSGTPITSVAPMRELTRLCMLLGGKEWILAAVDATIAEPARSTLRHRVATTCTYETMSAVLNRGGGGGGSAGTFEERVAAADATLGQIGEVLRQVEDGVTGTLSRAHDRRQAISALLGLSPLRISYYGRLNGNKVDHERYRDKFDVYDYSVILRKLRDTHVAAVSGATQTEAAVAARVDRNFEVFPDGSMYTNTVDPTAYSVGADGKVTWLRKTVLPGPPTFQQHRPWHSTREYVPGFVANRTLRVLHVSVPSYFERRDWRPTLGGANNEPKSSFGRGMSLERIGNDLPSPAMDGVLVSYVTEWVERNLTTTPEWRQAKGALQSFQLLGKQWPWYQFMWCLGVVFAAAAASRHESAVDDRGPVVVYLDRKSYDLTQAQMELLIHAVFDSGAHQHPLHGNCGYRGQPFQGPSTTATGVLAYQVGWPSAIDFGARPMSAWFGPAPGSAVAAAGVSHAAPAAFGRAQGAGKLELESVIRSMGEMFPVMLDRVANGIQQKTTLFDDELRLDIASTTAMRSKELMHVMFKDMWATEANGTSLNTEGDDLGNFRGLFIVGMPSEMSAQRMEQLYDRINRVNVTASGRRKFIVHITGHKQMAPDSTLGMLGKTELDDVVSHITAELARNAIDCDTNRLDAESGMMACKKKWTYEDTRVF